MFKPLKALPLLVAIGLCASSAASALEAQNGIIANGIIANGIIANGIIANGIIANGANLNGTLPQPASADAAAAQATEVILKDGTRVTLK